MKACFLKRSKVMELYSNVEANLDVYRSGDFDFLMSDPSCNFETNLEIDEVKISTIACGKNSFREVENCVLMHEAMGAITHYLARDDRLWVMLSHTLMLSYARARWPIPDENETAIKHIRTHFFCKGARGIERDNVAARLWWQASICSRAKGLKFEDALTCFLHKADVRANIVERPTTSQSVSIFSAILRKLHESYNADQELFERKRFRAIMEELNVIGGVRLLAALPENSIASILDQCIAKHS